ncbi:MAG: putative fatty-acid--CoA ligase, partial [Phenylobacterium sp.]|nr:putative fatty-acid--CoA ligase [Phenylobacterium sp.]
ARDRRRLTSIGFPPRNVQLKIADEDDNECPRETPGEILIRSPMAMLGYWNNSAATAETLRGGWVHTGDIGVMDEDGFVYLVDRKKDVIISGGENIYSREVENALYEHPAVAEAAVIGVPDARWGEAVRAVVALRPGAEVGEPELIAHCQSLIASYKKPQKVIFVEVLPKLASGKIDKKVIRQLYGVFQDSNPA